MPIFHSKQRGIRRIDTQSKSWDMRFTILSTDLSYDIGPRRCWKCNLKQNLWFCLHCGNLGCGRAQFGGSGGKGHGIEHYYESGHPIVVNLGTVTPESTADVHCYECEDSRLDPQLGLHLAYWGFDVAASEITERSLLERQMELGKMHPILPFPIDSFED